MSRPPVNLRSFILSALFCILVMCVICIRIRQTLMSSRSVSHPQRSGSSMVTDESARSDLHCAEDFLSSYKRQCEVEMTPKRSDSTKRVRRSSIAFNASIKSRGDRKDSSVGVETLWEESNVDAASDLCPCVPPDLKNFTDFDDEQAETDVEDLPADGVSMAGGRWKPSWCIPRHRIAVIIPFRNRENHLNVSVPRIRSFFRRQLLDFNIFVVEQMGDDLFNRGSLINAGFLYAKSHADFDCYIFHDVDQIPLDDRDFYTCLTSPRHIAGFQEHRNNSLNNDCYFGGIQAFKGEHFVRINGYSNMYNGWGGEDDDLLLRVWAQNMTVAERRPKCVSRQKMLQHKRDVGNSHGEYQSYGFYFRPDVYQIDGLNSLQYNLTAEEDRLSHMRLKVWLKPPHENSAIVKHFLNISQSTPRINPSSCKLTGPHQLNL